MTYIIGNRTPIIGDNRTPIVPGYTSGNLPEGDITGTSGGRDYVSGRGNPYQEPQGTQPQAEESPVMQEIETEWRAWWREYYGEEYQPGAGQYGRVFLDHLKPLENVTNAVKIEVLNVLKNRSTVNQEVGISNFITFGNLLFRYVGEGHPVPDARARAIREIQGDPVLYVSYTSGDAHPEEKGRNTLLYAGAGLAAVMFLTLKKKRK